MCRHHIDRIGAALERVVTDGVRSGEFQVEDPATTAACLHVAITRYCHPVLVSQYPNAPAPPIDAMIAFLLRALHEPALTATPVKAREPAEPL